MQADEPERDARNSFQIVVKPMHYAWLCKQCQILGTSKQQMIASALQEWLPRNLPAVSGMAASAAVEMALSDFILRHGDEFIALDEEE